MSQQPMYPAKNNSPKTSLIAAISAASTTIQLASTAALPDAPNLATLGTGDDAEVIVYTGKTAAALTGVTRGAGETTARAWPIGTIVARNFTALDQNTMQANIEDLDSAKAPLASPMFTGTPKAPTAAKGTNTTQIATTAFVQTGLADKSDTTHNHDASYLPLHGTADLSAAQTPILVTNGTDLNDLIPDNTTWYYVPPTISPNVLNKPKEMTLNLLVVKTAAAFRVQIATMYDGSIYTRRYGTDGTWTQWSLIVSEGNLSADSPVPFDTHTSTAPGVRGYYITDYKYHSGYVKSIKLNLYAVESTDDYDKTAYVIFINPVNGAVIAKYDTSAFTAAGTTGIITLPINKYFSTEFYIGIDGPCAWRSVSALGYKGKSLSNAESKLITTGSVIPDVGTNAPNWNTSAFILMNELAYDSAYQYAIRQMQTLSHNKMATFGDSIMTGFEKIGENTAKAYASNKLSKAIERGLGYKTADFSLGGSGISYWNNTTASGKNGAYIIANTDMTKYDVALIAYGSNDWALNVQLGSLGDQFDESKIADRTVTQSFYACTEYAIKTIKTANPYCTIIFSLPINRNLSKTSGPSTFETNWNYGTPNNNGDTLNDFCEALVTICNYYGLAYIDHRNGVFDRYAVPHLLSDNAHPTAEGHRLLNAETIAKLGAIIRPYPEYIG